jgi:hypothetical protein
MSALFTFPKQVAFNDGEILPGAKLYFFQTGTTTPQNTYQNNTLTTPHQNPVEADADGVFEPIYLDPTLPNYRVRYTDANDVQIWQVDGVPSNQNVQQQLRLESTDPNVFLYDTDGPIDLRGYRILSANGAFVVQAVNEAETVFQTILRYEGNILYSNETEVAVVTSGTFTGTLTGVVGSVTCDVDYKIVSNVVTLSIEVSATGTSNSTAFTITGLPVAVRPSIAKMLAVTDLVDNGLTTMAGRAVVSGSAITFFLGKTDITANYLRFSATAFTNSGTKGIDNMVLTYPL